MSLLFNEGFKQSGEGLKTENKGVRCPCDECLLKNEGLAICDDCPKLQEYLEIRKQDEATVIILET